MEERHDRQHGIVAHLRAGPGMNLRGVGDQIAVRQADDLGSPRGAASCQEERRTIERFRPNRLEVRVGLFEFAFKGIGATAAVAEIEQASPQHLGAIGELLPSRQSVCERGQDRDFGLDARAPDQRREHVERDHDATAGRRHERGDLFRNGQRTDRHRCRARHPNAIECGEELRHVRHQDADAIAGPHAELHQALRRAAGHFAQLAISQFVTKVDAGVAIGKFGSTMFEQSERGDGRIFQRVRDAGGVVGEPPSLALNRRAVHFLL